MTDINMHKANCQFSLKFSLYQHKNKNSNLIGPKNPIFFWLVRMGKHKLVASDPSQSKIIYVWLYFPLGV